MRRGGALWKQGPFASWLERPRGTSASADSSRSDAGRVEPCPSRPHLSRLTGDATTEGALMGTTDKTDHGPEADTPELDRSVDRRGFVRGTFAAAALAGLPSSLTAQGGGRGQAETPPPPRPLGQGDPPAMVFQPYPGGTGSYLEKIARERGREAFERARFTVEGWKGPVPTFEEEIAYLPAHRLAALLQARKISSVQLTDIYLNRI